MGKEYAHGAEWPKMGSVGTRKGICGMPKWPSIEGQGATIQVCHYGRRGQLYKLGVQLGVQLGVHRGCENLHFAVSH